MRFGWYYLAWVALVLGVTSAPALLSAQPPPVAPQTASGGAAPAANAPTSARQALPPVEIPPPDPGSEGVRYRLEVPADGLYRLAGADLAAVGVDLATLAPDTLMITTQGQPVAIRLMGMEDNRFDAEDAIEFYGVALPTLGESTKYTTTNVYWLASASAPQPRVEHMDATPGAAPPASASFWTTTRLEHQKLQWTLATTTPDGDETFFWERITAAGSSQERPLTFTVVDPAAEPYTATLSAQAYSRTTGQHRTDLLWGATAPLLVSSTEWAGSRRHAWEGTFAGEAIQAGENTLIYRASIDAGHPLHDVYLDFVDLTYRRRYQAHQDQLMFGVEGSGATIVTISGFTTPNIQLYDVSHPTAPVLLTGAQISADDMGGYQLQAQVAAGSAKHYLAVGEPALQLPEAIQQRAPTGLRASSNAADYLVITHPAFLTQAERLAQFRQQHDGFRTQVILVEDVYTEFNHGVFHPEAIRRLMAHALAHWTAPAPQYLVLVGDGNWNFPRSPEYAIEPTYIPPYLLFADPYQGEIASDTAFGLILGDDWIPEVAIGRLAVNNPIQAATMVDKTIGYEEQLDGVPLPWHNRALFVADNADPSGNYPVEAEHAITTHIPSHVTTTKLFLGVTVPDAAQMRTEIATAINAGTALVHYQGHGAVDIWAHEEIWRSSDISLLTNLDQLPIFVSLNCLDGSWSIPGRTSIAESLTRESHAGSVANWSPAGLGTTTAERFLQHGFLASIYTDTAAVRLGPATLAARHRLAAVAPTNELLASMTIFGDPALRLAQPPVGPCAEDLDGSGRVDLSDIQMVAERWKTTNAAPNWDPRFDLNQDGVINTTDLVIINQRWGQRCQG